VGLDQTSGDNKMPVEVDLKGEEFRRSIYIEVRRSRPLAMLHAFDEPVMEVNCERRQSSTVPTQSLMLMNSQFILDQATRFAARLKKEAGEDRSRQVERAWQLAFSRPPSEQESAKALDFLSQQETQLKNAAEKTDVETKDEKGSKEEKAKTEKAAKEEKAKLDTKPAPELQALTDLCQALLSANEFLYVD
jgi:hypothetical protein